jgi:acyl carrier protein
MDQKARLLIANHLGVSLAMVIDSVSFRSLGADSLDLVSLTMAFEETFDLVIPEYLIESCTTVGDAMRVLDESVTARSGTVVAAGHV